MLPRPSAPRGSCVYACVCVQDYIHVHVQILCTGVWHNYVSTHWWKSREVQCTSLVPRPQTLFGTESGYEKNQACIPEYVNIGPLLHPYSLCGWKRKTKNKNTWQLFLRYVHWYKNLTESGSEFLEISFPGENWAREELLSWKQEFWHNMAGPRGQVED